ncbi:CopD family protein [Pseudomonas sp. RIT-PI-S]|uniref:CopD family protein n=1 Tax=Pseudomonas sp. RIT-PI-S TaxID=3035295 RepID=UPI0021D8D11D|nr:CopD family protein [Pseudomonas sp. RIT-PI-S]
MTALVVFRFLHYFAVLSLFGISLFRPLLLKGAPQLPALRRRMDPILCLVALLGFLSAVGWLLAASAEMAGDWRTGVESATLRTVLLNTTFGRIWSAHVVLCLVQLVWWRIPNQRSPVPAFALATLVIATLAPVGHASMLGGVAGTLLSLNQLVHLAAVGGWVGALALLGWVALQPLGLQPARLALDFGRYGLPLVWVIVATGVLNLWAITGTLLPSAGPFAAILGVKLLAVAAMLGLALWHRRRALSATPTNLRLTLGLEWLCGLGALAAVALLGTLPPTL